MPQYNLNIVESGIKHHKTIAIEVQATEYLLLSYPSIIKCQDV
jgi:hypothetical protein